MIEARRFSKAEELYHAALEHHPGERDRFVSRACGGDQDLLREVRSLLDHQDEARQRPEEPSATAATQGTRPDPARRWVGRRIPGYEVLSPLGAGGMGEVYRAKDVRLDREVAIKVLPEAFSRDPQRVSRFRREARLLASLNHPNIAAIYGLEEIDEQLILALELVEGETLKERLERGAIPIEEALEIAKRIAEGLEAAHERGIVHRDLKPANVKLASEDKVKILDFGLAKAYAGPADSASASSASNSPTVAHSGTQAGVILGTAAYMAPEQASGKAVDRRADIWSFGVVLFEMLTGRRLFTGETTAEILASVIERDPPWDALPVDSPSALTKLLQRCLQKRPRQRLRDIADVRIELEDVLAGEAEVLGTEESRSPGNAESARPPRRRWVWAVGGLLIGALAASTAFLSLSEDPEAPPVLRFVHDAPEGFTIARYGDVPAVSPNGRHLAFTGRQGSSRQLWVRSLDAPEEARRLPGTERAQFAFWSPDSEWIAFFTDEDLRKVQLSGGPVHRICARPPGVVTGGTWGGGGDIVFANPYGQGRNARVLFTVAAEGGEARQLTRRDHSRDEYSHGFPRFLPDGRRFLFSVFSSREGSRGLYVASLDAPDERRYVLPGSPRAVYAAGHLLFGRNDTLLAQPLDLRTLQVSGEPVPLARNVPVWTDVPGLIWFGASSRGVLAHHRGGVPDVELVWLDRRGQRVGTLGEPGPYGQIALSPDGKRVAFGRRGQEGGHVWVMDVSRGLASKVTADLVKSSDPVWSPDGQELVLTSTSADAWGLFRKDLHGTTPAPQLLESGDLWPEDWSRHGDTLLYIGGNSAIWARPLAGDGPPELIVETEFQLDEARLSPDGRWLAYTSNESGNWEIYVQPFRRPGERVRVSVDGGGEPRWRGDGGELFYKSMSRRLMAVEVREGADRIDLGPPSELFQMQVVVGTTVDDYAVTADGQRFLVKVPTEEDDTASIHVVVNWPSLLEQ